MILVSIAAGELNVIFIQILIPHKHVSFLHKITKIGSIKARDMILVPKSICARAREFNSTSRKILKSCNHALHDNKFFL